MHENSRSPSASGGGGGRRTQPSMGGCEYTANTHSIPPRAIPRELSVPPRAIPRKLSIPPRAIPRRGGPLCCSPLCSRSPHSPAPPASFPELPVPARASPPLSFRPLKTPPPTAATGVLAFQCPCLWSGPMLLSLVAVPKGELGNYPQSADTASTGSI